MGKICICLKKMNKLLYSGHPINTDGTTAVNRMYVEVKEYEEKQNSKNYF